ncbi:MAG: twin-arginine translocase TatA/TatE family subunit [Pyrinomonadaceae bacterium]
MVLLFLESLGTTELLVILVVALVLFGPRRLPELTQRFGKSLGEFKRASDDFKRTWEREVALENVQREAAIERAMVAEIPPSSPTETHIAAPSETAPGNSSNVAVTQPQGASVARGAHVETPAPAADANEVAPAEQVSRKTDWL